MTNTYLAIFLGSPANPRMAAWQALPEAERQARQQKGIAAWKGWMETHKDIVVDSGGPLGKTKKISETGIADVSNALAGYVIVRANSHDAAAALFKDHPHFSIFPGDCVEVMPVMPIPGG